MSDATQPAADLEREANILASAWLGSILPKDEGTLLYVERQELLTIRAALARERELREALRELVGASERHGLGTPIDFYPPQLDRAVKRAEALLAQPAAGEEHVGSFFASEYGNPNVPPTGWHWTCSCGEPSGRLYRERAEAVSGHNVHRSAVLLARPAAGEERERG